MVSDIDLEALEETAYEQQAALIKEEYGQQASDNANYGWGVDETDDEMVIKTKVYGHGVLISTIDFETGEISHYFDD